MIEYLRCPHPTQSLVVMLIAQLQEMIDSAKTKRSKIIGNYRTYK